MMDTRTKPKCFRRSKSLKECEIGRKHRTTSSPSPIIRLNDRRGSFSKSADDILMDLSHVTDISQHGVVLVFNGFYKAETLRTLVGTNIEQEIHSYRRGRSSSFHNRVNTANTCSPTKRSSPIRKIKPICESSSPKAVVEVPRVEKQSKRQATRSSVERTSTPPSVDVRKEKRGIKLKRCLSLYDKQRKPHSCDLHASKTLPNMKPSPWTYGGNRNKDDKNRCKKTSTSPCSRVQTSTLQSFSVDSMGSRSSRLTSSLGSLGSTEFDLSFGQHQKNHFQTMPRSSSARDPGKPLPSSKNGKLYQKPSLIPRPVRPQSVPLERSMSFTYGTSSDPKPVRLFTKSPRAAAKNRLKRSLSISERITAGSEDIGSNLGKHGPVLTTEKPVLTTEKALDALLTSDSVDNEENWQISKSKSVYVAESEVNYPEPRPARRPKTDVFNPRDFTHIDKHALKTPDGLLHSFDELLDYLLRDLGSSLARVRAIYRWVVWQTIPLEINAREVTPDTPLGFLYNIRERKATYPELFATLCRRADIPCVIIYGVAKSIAYNVGDKVTHRKMKNSWNAVYIDGEWRFVHPYWARQSARGYSSGCWAVVESDDFHSDESIESKDNVMHIANDFFFLTDADKFITKCFPDEPSWQLLERHLSKHEFEELPFLQPAYYDLNLKIRDQHQCVIHAENGKARLCIEMPKEKSSRYSFKYKLFVHRDWEAEGEYDQILLDRYLLHYTENDTAIFEIRFPVSGMYKLELHCYDSKRTLSSNWICDYKISVFEPMSNCEPLPIVPAIGWGPGPELEAAGLESLTHKTGVVNVDSEPVTFLRFAFANEEEYSVEAELLANTTSRAELQSHVTVEQDGEHAVVKVAPPKEGEYALQIFLQNKESEKRQNVCNYLMHRTKIVEDPELADIRSRLVESTEAGELDALTVWIDKFVEKNMEDRGDLTEARRKLHIAKLNRDIKEAIARKDLSLLERTMQSCSSDTSVRRSLGHLASEAEAMRSRLRRLKRLQHAVLDMDQKTISEMRSYPKPPPAVHGVMAATFLLLGHKEVQLKKWSRIQGLISKRGKDSVKRRVANFKADDVSADVKRRARAILAKYDLEGVQIASIGAATFYQWASTMAGEAEF